MTATPTSIFDLIKTQEKNLGRKLIEAMQSEAGINKIIAIIADQQAEACKEAYKLGMEVGVLGAKLLPLKK